MNKNSGKTSEEKSSKTGKAAFRTSDKISEKKETTNIEKRPMEQELLELDDDDYYDLVTSQIY